MLIYYYVTHIRRSDLCDIMYWFEEQGHGLSEKLFSSNLHYVSVGYTNGGATKAQQGLQNMGHPNGETKGPNLGKPTFSACNVISVSLT